MNTPKVLRWLRSRPLARVRRNLATERRVRARLHRDWLLDVERRVRSDTEFRRAWERSK